ncbi:MAG: hypothetical protein ACKVUS_04020 [Saprospiraceae bacterium]
MLKIAFSPIYKYELPEGHRFLMAKYELLPEQLLWEGTVSENNFFHPDLLSEEVALLTHTPEWWAKMNEERLPVVVSMGGGYSPRIADIVEAHANTFRVAQEMFF